MGEDCVPLCPWRPLGGPWRAGVDSAVSALYNPAQPSGKLLLPGWQSAQVAQLVEQATENRCVGGSIPPLGTIPVNSPLILMAYFGEKSLAGKGETIGFYFFSLSMALMARRPAVRV